jgi:hypothetical protein
MVLSELAFELLIGIAKRLGELIWTPGDYQVLSLTK